MLKQPQLRLSQLASAVAVIVGGISVLPVAHAAAPTAGINISNIASASYTDPTGATRTSTSNEVKTTVLQVASFSLVADRSTNSTPNGQVRLAHTLTNTGNGTDSFTLNVANLGGDDFNFAAIQIFRDANNDGVPDNSTNLAGQTIQLAAGEATGLIVQTVTPNTATANQQGQLSISATSVFDNTQTDSNTDTVTVRQVKIEVTKSASVSLVNPGDTVEYTLTYKNTGNEAALDVAIEDILPANVTYVTGSATNNGAALTDGTDADGYAFNVAGRTATFTVANLPINTTGTIKFRVTVDAAAPAGAITNVATYAYDPDGPGGDPVGTPEPTNPSTVTVQSTFLGSINDSDSNNYNDAERTATLDDLIETTIDQGETAVFDTYVWNRGNSTETFDLTANTAGLPAGSTVQFFKADGVTPLTNTSGDTVVDTGPLAAGTSLHVVVKVTLPTSYAGVTGLDNLDTIITANPVNNPAAAANDTVTLRITDITGAAVDLTNGGNTPADGDGPYDPATIVDDATTEPGQPVTFPIAVTNDGSSPDTFNLTANVPAGWTVTFYEADDVTGACSTTVVTNTGSIATGATNKLCAVVTPPANEVPGTSDVVFTVTSTNTGATDSLKDQVTVDENRSLVFTPDRTDTVVPGGTVVYSHTLTNTGNVVEGDAAGELPINVTNTLAGVTTTVYVDLDSDGIADANELVTGNDLSSVLPGGINPGQTYTILVKVEAPAGAQDGAQDSAVITITPTGAINGEAAPAPISVTDLTTVTDSPVRLVKEQSLDADCNGTSDSGTFTQGTISAKPGECIRYRITATNEGSLSATNLVINDAVPAYTTLNGAVSNDGTVGTTSSTATTVTNTVGTLAPAAIARLAFGVQIDQ
jgi:trimeric autotransporter adhesin